MTVDRVTRRDRATHVDASPEAVNFEFSPRHRLIDEAMTNRIANDLYADCRFFDRPFLDIFKASLEATDAGINPFQAMNKLRRCANLCRLFLMAYEIEGDLAECGVFRGSTARLLVELMATGGLEAVARSFLLFDSFEGLPPEHSEDRSDHTASDGEGPSPYASGEAPRFSKTSAEVVATVFRPWPWVEIRKGWIPDVFDRLEERRYAFVHVDVDLYRSTLDCLEYFHPRMSPGGVIVCDDYLAPRFPGARRAWDEYCSRHGTRFVTLDNYQSAIFTG